jgi:hypothetical protein
MTVFRLWAPRAMQVEVQIGDRRIALVPEDHGQWAIGRTRDRLCLRPRQWRALT